MFSFFNLHKFRGEVDYGVAEGGAGDGEAHFFFGKSFILIA
jgi:hypothetical protein